MHPEDSIIPYHSTALNGKRVLIFAPHPDDETIGCGGSLALHRMANDSVKVVFLTNGVYGDFSGESERDEYIRLRREEARKAAAVLQIDDMEFWSFEDRHLSVSRGVTLKMEGVIQSYQPDLVYVPSPLEFHPDHRAAAFWLQETVRQCPHEFQIAFYEVYHPLRVNCLLDITSVLEIKRDAISVYQSQLQNKAYDDVTLSLNRFRSLTLPESVTHAEGFAIWPSDFIKKVGVYAIPFQQIEKYYPDSDECGPLVSIIIRTKNRPELLINALQSVQQQTYANIEIVLVNDGGEDIEEIARTVLSDVPLTYIRHQNNLGRSAAANSGLQAAKGEFFNILDDDDILYPDHVRALVSVLASGERQVAYSDIKGVRLEGAPGKNEIQSEALHLFNQSFQPDLLLFENYLPLMSVVFSRRAYEKTGLFCEEMDRYEGWEYLIRLSRNYKFINIKKTTAEFRFYNEDRLFPSADDRLRDSKSLSVLFNRIRPYLGSRTYFDYLTRFRSEKKGDIAPADEADRLSAENEREKLVLQEALNQANRTLDEIYRSKGWKWLMRIRNWKAKLAFRA